MMVCTVITYLGDYTLHYVKLYVIFDAGTFRVKMAAAGKKHKGYDISFKLEAVEYAEMNSNEKAAKKFRVRLFILRKRPTQQELINAGSPINAGSRINAGGSDLLYQ